MQNGEETTAEQRNDARLLFEKDPRLLIADDDRPFLNRLAKAMAARGFTVTSAESVAEPSPPSALNHQLWQSSTCVSRMGMASV